MRTILGITFLLGFTLNSGSAFAQAAPSDPPDGSLTAATGTTSTPADPDPTVIKTTTTKVDPNPCVATNTCTTTVASAQRRTITINVTPAVTPSVICYTCTTNPPVARTTTTTTRKVPDSYWNFRGTQANAQADVEIAQSNDAADQAIAGINSERDQAIAGESTTKVQILTPALRDGLVLAGAGAAPVFARMNADGSMEISTGRPAFSATTIRTGNDAEPRLEVSAGKRVRSWAFGNGEHGYNWAVGIPASLALGAVSFYAGREIFQDDQATGNYLGAGSVCFGSAGLVLGASLGFINF